MKVSLKASRYPCRGDRRDLTPARDPCPSLQRPDPCPLPAASQHLQMLRCRVPHAGQRDRLIEADQAPAMTPPASRLGPFEARRRHVCGAVSFTLKPASAAWPTSAEPDGGAHRSPRTRPAVRPARVVRVPAAPPARAAWRWVRERHGSYSSSHLLSLKKNNGKNRVSEQPNTDNMSNSVSVSARF